MSQNVIRRPVSRYWSRTVEALVKLGTPQGARMIGSLPMRYGAVCIDYDPRDPGVSFNYAGQFDFAVEPEDKSVSILLSQIRDKQTYRLQQTTNPAYKLNTWRQNPAKFDGLFVRVQKEGEMEFSGISAGADVPFDEEMYPDLVTCGNKFLNVCIFSLEAMERGVAHGKAARDATTGILTKTNLD